jgi:hypothetical protein
VKISKRCCRSPIPQPIESELVDVGKKRLDLVTGMPLLSDRTHAYLCASKGKVVPAANQRTSEVNKKQTVYILDNGAAIVSIAGTKAAEVSLTLGRVVEDVFRDDEIHFLPTPTVQGNIPPSLQSGIFHGPISSKLRDMNIPWRGPPRASSSEATPAPSRTVVHLRADLVFGGPNGNH